MEYALNVYTILLHYKFCHIIFTKDMIFFCNNIVGVLVQQHFSIQRSFIILLFTKNIQYYVLHSISSCF